jgi:hypothetical protein
MGIIKRYREAAGRYLDSREPDAERLAAACSEFPDQHFIRVFGGWLAVPAGTVIVQGSDLESLVSKLRKQQEGNAAG